MKRPASPNQGAATPSRSQVEGMALSRCSQTTAQTRPESHSASSKAIVASQTPCLLSGIGIRVHFQTRE